MFSRKLVSIGCLALLCTALTCFGQAVPEPSDEWSGSVTIGGDVTGDAQLVGDGVYEVTGAGADVWGTSDQFHYVYKELTGDGTISCRVADFGTGTNTWAKGGVMIRETLDANSKHTIMAMTGGAGAGITFQGRITGVGAASTGMHSDITAAPPQWVKLTREGNTFTAYYSADGVAWELFTDATPDAGHSNPIDVEMAATVKIGLFVTSHAAGQLRTYTIDNVSMEGDIVGENTYVPTATNPVPADGATELVAPISLQWDLALGATAYDVYVSEDADIDAADLVGTITETEYAIDTVPGATYYWRVDTADADLNTYEGTVWQFATQDIVAHFPSPANGAVWQATDSQVSFTSGLGAAVHHIYFSTDKALVDARDPSVATMFSLLTTLSYGELDPATTYYWAVDEFIVPETVAGPTWSFTTLDPIIAANIDSWNAVVATVGPAYQALHVADGVYDIGVFSGDQTYEFIVISDPCETEASMALIGRRDFGDTAAGIKYEQWNNTGTYGATIFGVADYDFGVPTAPGEYTHLVFVSDANSTTLFVNGVEAGSVATPISLSGKVGIGYGAQAEDGSAFFDDFDGSIFGVAIYDKALSAAAIEKNATAFFNPIAITDPNLVGWWTFDNVENGIVSDQSGHSNFGAVNGDLQLVNVGGGAAAQFDGATSYVDILPSAWSSIDTEASLAFWTYIDSATLPQNNVIVAAYSDPANNNARVFNVHLPWGSTIYFDSSGPSYDRISKAIPTADLADAWVHWAFIKNAATGVVSIYRNGDLWHSATGKVKPMAGADVTKFTIGIKPSLTEGWFTGMIDDVQLYDKALTGADVYAVMMGISDVTGADDVVQGVPNEVRNGDVAGWPDGEAPALAIDDNTGTKFLHFAGEVSPTGIQIAPAVGPTLVTGLTFTTANDSAPRDPITYELYGSNESIDGPYELIAGGDIADFNDVNEYPRFTKNATAIAIDNAVVYAYYQVLFPTVRDAANANSMQIAEVELLGVIAPLYSDGFESYEAGTVLQNVGGWTGWAGDAGAAAPVSDAFAYSGLNSVEILGSADLVQEFEIAGGTFVLTAMQYIPSGTTGTTYFILMNQYGGPDEWSTQTTYNLDTGEISAWGSGLSADVAIQYDTWVQIKLEVDLDANTVVEYYNGVQIDSKAWSASSSGVFGAIDLFGNGASSVYYDDIVVE